MWLNNLRLVLPDRVIGRGALRIEDGYIAEIVERAAATNTHHALDVQGLTAIPGIIDLHGDMLERDIEPRPGARFPVEIALHELDKRLAASGVTTAFAAVSFAWTQNDLRSQDKAVEIIHAINAHRENLMVDFQVHARFEITNPDTAFVLKPLLERREVQLVSVMDHTPGQGQYGNSKKYIEFMTRWIGFDPDVVGEKVMTRLENSVQTRSETPRNWTVVREVAATALEHDIPVASHDDDTVEKVRMLAEMGVTMSEFPVTLEGAKEAKRQGMHVIMGAPNAYRGESNTGNLSARQAIRVGVVDILASDYFPAAMFHCAQILAAQGEMPLYESMKLISQHPAEAMGLHDRGQIAVGQRADLVLFDSAATPRVRATFRQGMPIYWDGLMARLAQQQGFHSFHLSVSDKEIS